VETGRRAIGVDDAIEPLAVQAADAVDLAQLGRGNLIPSCRRDPHAERLVSRQPLEAFVLRLQQAVARRTPKRLSEVTGGKSNEDELVVDTARAQAHADGVNIDAEGITREVTKPIADLLFVKGTRCRSRRRR